MGVLDDAFLEAEEVVAAGVSFHRRRLAQDVAQIDEMLLVGGRFLALVAGPFLFEFSDRHAHWGSGYSCNQYVAQTLWAWLSGRGRECAYISARCPVGLSRFARRARCNRQALAQHNASIQ